MSYEDEAIVATSKQTRMKRSSPPSALGPARDLASGRTTSEGLTKATVLVHQDIPLLMLPLDAVMPSFGQTANQAIESVRYIPPFQPPDDAALQWAYRAWIFGHHAFFVCLDAGTYAARKVTQSARSADLDAAEA
jgi:hypothetical protein